MNPAPAPDPPWDAAAARAFLDALAARVADPEVELARGLDPAGRAMERRRWVAEAAGALPPAALVAILRELEGARLHAAGLLRLAVCGEARTFELARARFGGAPRLVATDTPAKALAAASAGAVAVCAIAARSPDRASGEPPWWGRLLARPQLKVFARLPASGAAHALAAAEVETAPSGDDETFWVTDAAGTADALEARLGEAGFAADLLAEAGGLKLFALKGYVQADDGRLARAPGRLSGVIGAGPSGPA